MILENGVIRTMDPSLPVARALAIAGDRIAGGVGTHEIALASPERIDLGGRCVLPGFNDAHVHFPTWSLAQRQVRLEGTASLDEALERIAVAARDVPPGGWLRGMGWRSGDWVPSVEPTKEALDRVTGDTPAASLPCTTRTAGSARSASGNDCATRARCHFASGSRCRPTMSTSSPTCVSAAASATTSSAS